MLKILNKFQCGVTNNIIEVEKTEGESRKFWKKQIVDSFQLVNEIESTKTVDVNEVSI